MSKQTFVRSTTCFLLILVAFLSIISVVFIVLYSKTPSHTPVFPSDDVKSQSVRPQEQKSEMKKIAVPEKMVPTSAFTHPMNPWEKDYRIPNYTLPLQYDLYLFPDLQEGTFSGQVTIYIGVLKEAPFLVAHIKELNISSTILMSKGTEIPLRTAFLYEPNEFWVVQPEKTLLPGNYSLEIKFRGDLEGSIVGFYKSVYKTKSGEKRSIATSKFQPTDARSAFPCFDEPTFKSTFAVTLVRPSEGYIALSNMPVEEEIPDSPQAGFTEVRFAMSVPMVTYLACFIVCDFEYVQAKTQGNKDFRVYARPDELFRANYSLNLGVDILNYFENYFEIEYPLPKQDMIAIPDFISGAMEHWGLITYREVNLLYDNEGSSSFNKQRVAAVVAHELVHMWFGNLMTLKWWDDLWLNEGFASYVEYKGVAQYEKDWAMEEQFLVDDLQRVMVLDAQLSSHPIVQEVNNPNEITEIFDAISYSKGASVLRMLEDFMGAEDFRIGIRNFLRKYKYANAVTQDLWTELEHSSSAKLNITSIMDTWTRQMGYPVLNVKSLENGKLEIRQSRFLANPRSRSPKDSKYGYKWDVPITYRTNSQERKLAWLWRSKPKMEIDIPADTEWTKINMGQYGYYRVNYDASGWSRLTNLLKTNPEFLLASDRSNLLDDAFALAASGLLPYGTAMQLSTYLLNENHYIPWKTAYLHIKKLDNLLESTSTYPLFRKYVSELVESEANRVGWSDSGTHLERRQRILVLDLACHFGSPQCLEKAKDVFKSWIDDPYNNSIPVNFRSLVYRYGVQLTGEFEWDILLERYSEEFNAQEKVQIATGLTEARAVWIIQKMLRIAGNESIVRSQDFFSILVYFSSNPVALPVVWDYIRVNWKSMVDRFTLNNRYLGSMVKTVTEHFAEEMKLAQMRSFFEKYPEAGSGKRAREQALEKVEENIIWIQTNAEAIKGWLQQNFENTI